MWWRHNPRGNYKSITRKCPIKGNGYSYPFGITSQFYYCGMPFRLDVGRRCIGKCSYCYARSRAGNYRRQSQVADPERIIQYLAKGTEEISKPRNAVIECLRNRVPLHFGGMSDPLLVPDSCQRISVEILKALDRSKYPTLISTKAEIGKNKEIAELILGKPHFAVQLSFSTFDAAVAEAVEPGTPSPQDRLRGAELALQHGNWVSCRLQPFFPVYDIDELVGRIKSIGFKHLTIEHFKLAFDKDIDVHALSRMYGIEIAGLFPRDLRIKRGREWEMPYGLRFASAKLFLKACRKYRMPLGIGDNGFQHLSSTGCCCGIDSLPGFENWLKYNSLVAVQRADSNGRISLDSIENEWTPQLDISRMINSKTRLKDRKNTIRNHIKAHWTENRQFSPRFFYGVKVRDYRGHYSYSVDKT